MAPGPGRPRRSAAGAHDGLRGGGPQEVTAAVDEPADSGPRTDELRRLAGRGAAALARTRYVPRQPDEIEELLLTFLRRLVDAARGSAAAAASVGVEVGAALVDAHFTSPRPRSQRVRVLLEGLSDTEEPVTGRPPASAGEEGGGDVDP